MEDNLIKELFDSYDLKSYTLKFEDSQFYILDSNQNLFFKGNSVYEMYTALLFITAQGKEK